MKPGVAARANAATLVGRIEREGAWSNVVTANLSGDDAALIRHLVYGTTRNRPRIDRAIEAASTRPFGSINKDVLDVLRVAFHEVLFGRAADHAVTDSAVEAVKANGQPAAAGFVNALVRSVQRTGEIDPAEDLAGQYGMPEWLVAELAERWGSDTARAFCDASHKEPRIGLRMRKGGPLPEGVDSTGIAGAGYLGEGTVPQDAIVQDPASVAVVRAVGAQPGERVLEIGAAPGGKSIGMSDDGADVTALDTHRRRVRASHKRTSAADSTVRWVVGDGRTPPFPRRSFDRVLLDAPCTGLGTLRRRPEIKFKATVGERDRLAALQRQLLDSAMQLVRPDGLVVYSVCTVTEAETTGVIDGRDSRAPDGLPGSRLDGGLLLAPHLTDTDGMFIALIGA